MSEARYFVQYAGRNTVFYVVKFQVEKMNNPYCEVLGMEKKGCGKPKDDKKKK